MKTITASPGIVLPLGREGENNARQILFDITDWQAEFGADGTVTLLAQLPDATDPYPVAVSVSGSTVTWLVSSADTSQPGAFGHAELQYRIGDVVVKSSVWQTFISNALGTPSPIPPEPQQAWVDQVLEAAQQASVSADTSAASATAAGSASASASSAATNAEASNKSAEQAAQLAQAAQEAAAQSAQAAQLSAEQASTAAQVPTVDLTSDVLTPVVIQPGSTATYNVGAAAISALTDAANSGRAKLTVGIQIPGTQTVVPAMVFAGAGQIQIPGSVQYQFSGSFGYNYILFGAILDWSQNGTSLTVTCKPNWAT